MGVSLVTVLILHACFLSICVAKHEICKPPSSCGDIRNISYPFRLRGDPPSCGFHEYELICENNRTMINLYGGKYYVAEINYDNYTIRVVDPGLIMLKNKKNKPNDCWISGPLHSVSAPFYTHYYRYDYGRDPYSLPRQWRPVDYYYPYYDDPSWPSQLTLYTIVPTKCEQAVSDDNYIPINPCTISDSTRPTGSSSSSSSSSPPTYSYALLGDFVPVGDIPNTCTIGTYMVIQHLKLKPFSKPRNLSMSDLQDSLLSGLQLSFLEYFCNRHCATEGQYCNTAEWNAFQCYEANHCEYI